METNTSTGNTNQDSSFSSLDRFSEELLQSYRRSHALLCDIFHLGDVLNSSSQNQDSTRYD